MYKVVVYIDGFNFYYGLKANNWQKFYWIDIVKLFSKFLGNNQELIKVKYFTATPKNNGGKAKRQDSFLQANELNSKFQIIRGNYLLNEVYCPKCGDTFLKPEEKKTDVNIATEMIKDVINGFCDISILVSGDSDLTPPIEFIKEINPSHTISVFFPPRRNSCHLKQISRNTVYLQNYKQYFKESIMDEKVRLLDGKIIEKPYKWKQFEKIKQTL